MNVYEFAKFPALGSIPWQNMRNASSGDSAGRERSNETIFNNY